MYQSTYQGGGAPYATSQNQPPFNWSTSSTSSYPAGNTSTWSTTATPGFGSSTAGPGGPGQQNQQAAAGTSGSNYTPGYLLGSMTASTPSAAPSSSPSDSTSLPLIQTTARLNTSYAGPEGISDSIFASSGRAASKRRTMTPGLGSLADDNAPPRQSVFDIPGNSPPSAATWGHSRSKSLFATSQRTTTPGTPGGATAAAGRQPLYIVVYGYPPDRYSVTADYFQRLSAKGAEGTTVPTPDPNIVNSFRIGYHDHGEALRAVRKDGEILHLGPSISGGTPSSSVEGYYIGVKLADPAALAENPSLGGSLGLSLGSSTAGGPSTPIPSTPQTFGGGVGGRLVTNVPIPMDTDLGPPGSTPMRLQPSSSAFRPKTVPSVAGTPMKGVETAAQASPSKGVLGTVGDMLFGW